LTIIIKLIIKKIKKIRIWEKTEMKPHLKEVKKMYKHQSKKLQQKKLLQKKHQLKKHLLKMLQLKMEGSQSPKEEKSKQKDKMEQEVKLQLRKTTMLKKQNLSYLSKSKSKKTPFNVNSKKKCQRK